MSRLLHEHEENKVAFSILIYYNYYCLKFRLFEVTVTSDAQQTKNTGVFIF